MREIVVVEPLDRLAQGLACGALALLAQMPFFWVVDEPLPASYLATLGVFVLGFHLALSLLLGRWRRVWVAVAFTVAPALGAWPGVHLEFGHHGLMALAAVVAAVAIALVALLPAASPLVAAAAGAVLGGELARWGEGSHHLEDLWRSLLFGVVGVAALAASPRWRLPAPLPGARGSLALAAGAVALAVVAGPVRFDSLPEGPPGEGPVDGPAPAVLIVLDTVRADHLTSYGYERDTAPQLDRFAREHAVVVERAVSNGAASLPSHASLFTGLVPPRHGAHYPLADDPSPPTYAYPLAAGIPTLAEQMGERGYWTVGVSANAGPLSPAYGLHRGFDVYRAILNPVFEYKCRAAWHMASRLAEPLEALSWLPLFSEVEFFLWGVSYRRADVITDEAIELIDRAGDHPFFLFVNYFDAHHPYNPPLRCRDAFSGRLDRFDRQAGIRETAKRLHIDGKPIRPEVRAHHVSLYDGELRCLDEALGRLLARLERHPRWDEMLVVVTSDHGEALGDHQLMGHGLSLYDELTWVPLIVKPGWEPTSPEPGTRIAGPMQSVDVFPTVLEHAGVTAPADGDGRPWGRGRRRAQSWLGVRRQYAEVRPDRFMRDLRAVEEEGWKLVVGSNDRIELYDLQNDPDETIDRNEVEPERVERRLGRRGRAERPDPPRVEPGDEALERLRVLGYLE